MQHIMINGRAHERITLRQVKNQITKQGTWRGYVKGVKLNTMYDPPMLITFNSMEDLQEFINSWNYYKMADYGYICYFK